MWFAGLDPGVCMLKGNITYIRGNGEGRVDNLVGGHPILEGKFQTLGREYQYVVEGSHN